MFLAIVIITRTHLSNLVAVSKVAKSGTDIQVILCIKDSINCRWIAEFYGFLSSSRGAPFLPENE